MGFLRCVYRYGIPIPLLLGSLCSGELSIPFTAVQPAEFESKDRSACDRETPHIALKRGAESRYINTEYDHEH
jgi:hypothetical protein